MLRPDYKVVKIIDYSNPLMVQTKQMYYDGYRAYERALGLSEDGSIYGDLVEAIRAESIKLEKAKWGLSNLIKKAPPEYATEMKTHLGNLDVWGKEVQKLIR